MKKRSSALLMASALLASPAMAGTPAPEVSYQAPAEEFSWTGFYFGVQFGAAFNPDDDGELEFDRDGDGDFGGAADQIAAFGDNFEGSTDASFTGGINGGYDHQFGKFVLGGLLEFNFANVSQEQSGFSSTPAFYTEQREIDFMASGRVKLGYAVSDRILIYATGGLAYANVEHNYLTNTPAAVASRGTGDQDWGYVVGLGMEGRITRHISLGVEYLYSNFGDSDYTTNLSGPGAFSGPGSAGSTDSRGSDRDFDFHTVQAKLTYRF